MTQQDVSDQHVLQFFSAARRFGKDEYGRRRGDGINDTNEGFLGNSFFAHARDGKGARTHEGESEREKRDLQGILIRVIA